MKSLKELLAARAKLIADARKLLDTADAGKRKLSAEEETEYQKIDTDIDKLSDDIDQKNSDSERAERLGKYDKMLAEDAGRQVPPTNPATEGDKTAEPQILKFGRAGDLNLADLNERDGRLAESLRHRASPQYLKAFRNYILGVRANYERLGMQVASDPKGGYLAPIATVSMLIKFLDDLTTMRQLGTVLPPTTAKSVGALSYDTDLADADWTPEVPASAISEDDAARFGKREMMPHMLSKLVKTSRKLLSSSVLPIEQFLTQRLAYKFSISENKAFLSGTGQQRPLGVFTSDTNGIGTGRDVTCVSATAFTADELIDMLESLKDVYQQNATWLVSREFRKRARKLKSGTGEYLLTENNNAGGMTTLLNRPLRIDENAPNTFTTGRYIAVLADFSFYWIQDGLDLEIQRLDELLSLTNQVGWIARKETDGMPVLEEAFSRLKLG